VKLFGKRAQGDRTAEQHPCQFCLRLVTKSHVPGVQTKQEYVHDERKWMERWIYPWRVSLDIKEKCLHDTVFIVFRNCRTPRLYQPKHEVPTPLPHLEASKKARYAPANVGLHSTVRRLKKPKGHRYALQYQQNESEIKIMVGQRCSG
jgi:hypothetical protein